MYNKIILSQSPLTGQLVSHKFINLTPHVIKEVTTVSIPFDGSVS